MKQNRSLGRKIGKRSYDLPPIQPDDLIDFHFLLQDLNSYQIYRLMDLVGDLNIEDPHSRN